MKQVVSATYKKLLAGARKVDSDPALRAMLATAPLGKGREVDSSERSESESQHEVHIQSLLRKLNGNCERYHPERPVDPSLFHLTSEKAPSPGKPSSRSDKPSLGTFVQKTFRRSVLSSGSLDSAFAALKLINGVLDMQRHLPSAPSYPGRSLGFQVMPCVTRKDVDLALRDPPFCRSPFLDAVRARRLNLLVAQPMRQGFFFQHSIVLVAALHKAEAIGFIINKPLTADDSVPLRVGDTVPETFHRLFHTHLKDHPVMLGGAAVFVPSMDLAVALVHRIPGVVGAKVLAPGLWLNGSFEALSAKLDAKVASPSDVMFVTGCCLWKANELEREICHQGRWIVLVKEAVDPKAPSVEPATEITERDLSLYEEDPADLKARADAYLKLVSQPEDPVAAGECARLVLGTQAACLDRRSARAGKQEGSKDGDCKCPFPKQLWVEVLGGLNPEYRAMSRISDVEALQGKGDEE